MRVSKQNNFVKIYQAMYPDRDLPRSVCPLFWSVIIGSLLTLVSPYIMIWGIIRKSIGKNFYAYERWEDEQLKSYFFLDKCVLVIHLFTAVIVSGNLNDDNCTYPILWHHWIVGPIIVGIFLGLALLLIIGCIMLWDFVINKNTSTSNRVESKPSVMGSALKGWWNKVCPLIEYED